MTDKKLTDEEIISSLEVIATTGNCEECKIRNCKWGTCNCSQITANAALELINRQKDEIERLKEFIVETRRCDKEIKSEAVKEFAEKLKEKSFKTIRNYGLTKDVVEICDIDNLLKEKVGEEE